MALLLAQKSDVRRHLRYPLAGLFHFSTTGGTLADGTASYRYFQPFAFLEWRLNNLAPDEEARLTGNGYAAMAFVGPAPQSGSVYNLTFSGGNLAAPVTVQVVSDQNDIPQNSVALSASYAGSNNGLLIAAKVAAAVNLTPALQAAKIFAVAPFGTGSFSYSVVPIPEVAFVSPVGFNFSFTYANTNLAPSLTADGAQLHPMMENTSGTEMIWGYVPSLNYLETQYATASRDLSTSKADVWKARATELPERFSLYSTWQSRLAEFLDVPLNPNARTNLRSQRPSRFF